ncbi:MAG: heavy metal translocating P-type ATPase [Haloplasmataceae bacterium]|nr:heavy metal translocating P-type ATPase [Haloplasmataceae bacterium]
MNKGYKVLLTGIIIVTSIIIKELTDYLLISSLLLLVATIIAGIPIMINALRSLRYKIISIDLLVSIAVIGAIIINEYFEGAAVTFLFMFGNYLESKTLEKTRSAIKSLLDLAPDTARVLRDHKEIEIAAKDVVKDDLVVVKPGEKIPVDGVIIEGNAYVNQAAITGESMPVNKEVNQNVFSSTIIESGYLKIKAEKVGEDTTFSRILEMVEVAQDKKAKTQKFLEKFSQYYTPSIIVLAIIVYLFTKDFELALTFLVIACPGALVISTPVSIVAGIGNGAKHGVLIKGGEIIEKLGSVKVVAFDKTGTLTIGKPQVTRVKAYGISETELIRLTASAEMYSEHPLARAVIDHANELFINNLVTPDHTEIITGHGIIANVLNKPLLVGNRKLLLDNKIVISKEIENEISNEENNGQTVVLVTYQEKLIGIISIADAIRKDADLLIKKLKKQGVKKVVMLTGDNIRVAKSISEKLGLDHYYSELLPEDKVTRLKQLQKEYGTTVMVGDGVNDAPAIASADFGIAVGGAGSDVAMETADVVLLSNEINKLNFAIGLSRATVRNMKQNIYFAIFIVIILLTGVLAKFVFLSSGMFIHELSVLAVIINAIRLLKYKD